MTTQVCPYCAEEIQSAAIKCRYCHSWLDQTAYDGPRAPRKRLTRSNTDRMVAGVCGGVAEYFDVDPTMVRLAYVVTMCLTAFIPGLVAYVILAFVVPKAQDQAS